MSYYASLALAQGVALAQAWQCSRIRKHEYSKGN